MERMFKVQQSDSKFGCNLEELALSMLPRRIRRS